MIYATYRHKYNDLKKTIDFCLKCFAVGVFIGVLIETNIFSPASAKAKLIDPTATSGKRALTIPPTGQEGETVGVTYAQFKTYVQKIFGSEWKTAVAVSQCECSNKRKEWPVCINSWGTNNGNGEHSVGAFQINLARNGGKGAWVHAEKIPGVTIGQKEIWLSDFKQNVMMAKIIRDNNGWGVWTGFTNGCYKTKLNKI